ncbi:acyl-CoA dehydrogenase family protein [bacterium]|nr:acyl-CoA dehydrogenase family protein [bacterium]
MPDKPAESAGPSFTKGMFFGQVLSNLVFPYPKTPEAERELLQMTSDAIQRLEKDFDLQRMEKEKRLPPEFLQKMREMGLFGLIIPEEFGGVGLSNSGYVQMMSELSMLDASICTTIGAHQSIGMKALLLFGTTEQKEKYLPRLASGEWIAAFGLTEPGAGSDAGSLKTSARLTPEGDYVLNGSKIWISNGGLAHFYTVFAKTKHPDGKGGEKESITAFIVTRDMPGFSNGPEEKKLGLWGSSTTALSFENVRVPAENILGQAGKGFKVAMTVLNNGRLGLAGACALGPRKLIQMARNHALERKQFGFPIADFGLIQSKFGLMTMDSYVGEALVCTTAHLMDQGDADYSLESAICKVFNTEAEWRTVNECLQIAGGTGYMAEYRYEKLLRDSRIFMIWEGANEVLRLFIGLSGLQGPGEQLKEVSRALRQPMQNVLGSIGVLSEFGVRWFQRKVGATEKLQGVHPELAAEAAVFESYVARLAAASEAILRREGKEIIHNQFAVRRLADTAIDLYALACTLSRASRALEEKGVEGAAIDRTIAKAFCRKSRRRMAENLRRMRKNDDSLEKQIARHVYEQGLPQHALFQ